MDPKTAPQPDDAAEEPEVESGETNQTPTPAADGGTQKDDAAEWKKRSAGWQRTAQQKDEEIRKLKDELLAEQNKNTELQSQLNEFTLKADSLEKNAQAIQNQHTATQAELQQKEAALNRLNILLDYPGLTPMREMLRTDITDDTEYRNYLDQFDKTVSSLTENSVRQAMQGSSPGNAGGGQREAPELTHEQIYERLMSGEVANPEEQANLLKLLARAT